MARKYSGPIVDIDIHHGWKRRDEILEYLPQRWREYAVADPRSGAMPGHSQRTSVMFNVPRRRDVTPPDGSPAGTDYETMCDQLLDRHNIHRGVLTWNTGGHVNGFNRDFAIALSRAAHDWNAETWLARDPRLYGVLAPPMSAPLAAAAEIRRAGANEKIVATLLPGTPLNIPYGDPIYHPVYEAASELGLAIHMHVGAVNGEQPPGGLPLTATGGIACESQQPMHHITSFIVNGVFEKYPNLRVIVKEFGTAWLPYLMWRLDDVYDVLKFESAWVKRWPSEYIHEHIRLDTQPFEEGWRADDLERVLSTIDGVEDLLCFASDYPHGAADDPQYVAQRLPSSWVRKVMFENACRCYGWPEPRAARSAGAEGVAVPG